MAFSVSFVTMSLPPFRSGPVISLVFLFSFLVTFTSIARFNSRLALAFLTPSLQDQIVTLCSSWVTCPASNYCTPLIYILISVKSSLLFHAGLLQPGLDFLLVGMDLSWACRILEYQPALADSSSLQGCIPWDCSKQMSEEAKVCSPEIRVCAPAFCPVTSSSDRQLHHLMVTAANAASVTSTFLNSPSLFCKSQIQESTFLVGIFFTCVRNSSSVHSDLLQCLSPAVFSFQQIAKWLKPPVKTRACEPEASSRCLKKASSTASAWSGCLQQSTHYNSTHLRLPTYLDI